MTVPVDVRNPEHAMRQSGAAVNEAARILRLAIDDQALQRLATVIDRNIAAGALSNEQLADRLIEDVWAEMSFRDPRSSLLFEAIGRIRDTWSREQMVGAR